MVSVHWMYKCLEQPLDPPCWNRSSFAAFVSNMPYANYDTVLLDMLWDSERLEGTGARGSDSQNEKFRSPKRRP